MSFIIRKETVKIKITILKNNIEKVTIALKEGLIAGEKITQIVEWETLAWLDIELIKQINDLESLLTECRFKVIYDDNGNLIINEFTGEKIGEERLILNSLAPFVEKDSFMTFHSEWYFNDVYQEYKFDGTTANYSYKHLNNFDTNESFMYN